MILKKSIQQSKMDTLSGAIIGCALGDALGAPHEFKYCKDNKYTGDLYLKPKFLQRFKGYVYGDIGQVTDDTEMTITMLRSIKEEGKYKKDKVLMAYLGWANSDGFVFMGKNTRALFKGIKTKRGYENRYKKMLEENSNNQSNGALMRCSPLCLHDIKNVIEDCCLTNPHPICVWTNIIYLHFMKNSDKNDPWKTFDFDNTYKLDKDDKEILIKLIVSCKDDWKRDVTENKGWCLHALYCAIYSFYHFKTYKEAIDFVIRKGGDTDTNAAITGALLGNKFGYKVIYEENKKNIDILLACTTQEGNMKRPKEYTLHDVFKLVK